MSKFFGGNKPYDFAVFIGRFQPFHVGHQRVIDRARELAHNVIVLIGSADSGRTLRNPFTFNERKEMILGHYDVDALDPYAGDFGLHVEPLSDIAYNDTSWVTQVQKIVDQVVLREINKTTPNVHLSGTADARVCLIGHSKDNTSYYLKLFPQWAAENVPQTELMAATNIRDQYFFEDGSDLIQASLRANLSGKGPLPKSVAQFLLNFLHTAEYTALQEEYTFIRQYKAQWANSPYPPVFVTGDAVVVQSGHILLVTRGKHPGKGLLALPGGFVNQDENIIDGVVRELREETGMSDNRGAMPPAVLKGYITHSKVYDNPNRDPRGRIITHAYLFKLPDSKKLYEVKGQDDAEFAQWYPLGSLTRAGMYADHYDIIQDMLAEV